MMRLKGFYHLHFPAAYLDILPQNPNCVDALFSYSGSIEERKQLIDVMEQLWEYRIVDIHNQQEFELVHRIVMNLALYSCYDVG